MNETELNLAMCEWMGWTHYHEALWVPPNTTDFSELDCGTLPDYLSDDSPRRLLNEAESRLTEEQHSSFRENLAAIVGCNGISPKGAREYVSAPAYQRVIAIMRTVKPELFQ